MSALVIEELRVEVAGSEIIRGLDLSVPEGEMHAVMGPNGSGKSTLAHVLMGRDGFEVTGGSIRLGDVDLLPLSTYERARAGLFLGMQYPIEVPGVSLEDALVAALDAGADPAAVRRRMESEADRINLDRRMLDRPLNVDLSGGEKKRNEAVQLAVLRPRIAVLDEIDSGLDLDALGDVARRIRAAVDEDGVGVVAITHYSRLLHYLSPDIVHVLVGGRIVRTGGPEVAEELEESGYESYAPLPGAAAGVSNGTPDPFADPLA